MKSLTYLINVLVLFYSVVNSIKNIRTPDLLNKVNKEQEIRNITRINNFKDLILPAPFEKDSNMLIHDINSNGKIFVGPFPHFNSPAWVSLFDLFINFENKTSQYYINSTLFDTQDYYIPDDCSIIHQGRKIEIRGFEINFPKTIDIGFCSGLEDMTSEVYLSLIKGKLSYISYKKKSKKGGLFLGYMFGKFLKNLFENIEEAETYVYEKTDVDYIYFKKGYNFVDCCLKKFPIIKNK